MQSASVALAVAALLNTRGDYHDLEKLVYALHLSKRNQRIVRQNLVLSAVVIAVLVAGAVTGVFTLPIAVLGHEISEFVVIGNGLRMLRG